MKQSIFITVLLASLFGLNNISAQIIHPVKWKYSSEAIKGKPGQYYLYFDATIDDNWYIYSQFTKDDGPLPTLINFDDSSQVKFIATPLETGAKVKDEFDDLFGMRIKKFGHTARFTQTICIVNDKKPIKGSVTYMTCSDRCINEDPVPFEFKLAKGECGANNKKDTAVKSGTAIVTPADTTKPIITDTNSKVSTTNATSICFNKDLVLDSLDLEHPVLDCVKSTTQHSKSIWTIFLLGFAGGLIALLTPCVFPMIPLTVSFFTKGAGKGRKGVFNAGLYSLFIFLIYVLLSVPFHLVDNLDPGILNNISTNVYLNVGFFIIFVVFAFSFFGYFELALPGSLSNRIDSASDIGGVLGIFFMALTLAIVSFSCTGPILGSLLGLTAEGGTSANQLSAGMAGFGLALALPFGLFAAFPSWLNSLPKSGGWLNTVKVVIGFVELALSLKFLSNADLVEHWGLLKREVFFGIWILIGLATTLYLFGAYKFPHDSPMKKLSKTRLGIGIAFLLFTIYLVPGITNTAYSNVSLVSGFPPPMYYSLFDKKTECALGLDCHKNDLCSAMADAQKAGKPIFIDFTGFACVNCRKNEEHVWPDPAIFEKLSKDFVVVSLYVDDRKTLPANEQMIINDNGTVRQIKTVGNKWTYFQRRNFKDNSQPFYAIISPGGRLLTHPIGGYINDKRDFLNFLNCGFTANKQLLGR